MKKFIPEKLVVLTDEQRKEFLTCLPSKVYKTERNISIVVVFTQLIMILLFLSNRNASFDDLRGLSFFLLYHFLLIATLIAIFSYRYTYLHQKQKAFIWTRRIYASVMCIWVVGITYLEQMNGRGGTTYFYLLPTMAALLLLTPLESTILFGTSWVAIATMFLTNNATNSAFGNMVNSMFVTILTLFISYRYYRSMAVEFCDRKIISSQYQEIEVNNGLLKQMAHIDQLTTLYNRHYLIEMMYPLFEKCKNEQYYGLFLMLDIDYFKQYNDTYGHIQGDECIKSISKEIKKISNQNGLTAIRYGGEEFLVIKMDQKPIEAMSVANTLLKAIWDLNLIRQDIELKQVSVSIGLYSDPLRNIAHIETAIKNADIALYEAKNMGRNRIVVSKDIR